MVILKMLFALVVIIIATAVIDYVLLVMYHYIPMALPPVIRKELDRIYGKRRDDE